MISAIVVALSCLTLGYVILAILIYGSHHVRRFGAIDFFLLMMTCLTLIYGSAMLLNVFPLEDWHLVPLVGGIAGGMTISLRIHVPEMFKA